LPPPPAEPDAERSSGASSRQVAAAILLSRVAGLVREALFSQFFGLSLYADAFRAALRMPNLLQNLLGEGTLSASFIPVYSELLGQGRKEEAGRVAGAVFALLFVLAGLLALTGYALAPLGVALLFPGFSGETRELTVTLVRILFPMTGVLVLSAWALGILNSHRRFFLSYIAPVAWNAAIIGVLVVGGLGFGLEGRTLVLAAGWGALGGGLLQFLVQVPAVLRLERHLKIRWDLQLEGLRETVRNAGPAVVGRGVVQVSGYLDIFLASALATSAVAALSAAQTLYMLPVSLFGMSVAVAELPELSRERAAADPLVQRAALVQRTAAAQRRVAFYVVPSVVAFLLLGDTIVGGLYQRGAFGLDETSVVHIVLAGYAVGLVPSTSTRLYSSTFFALRDTRTPARMATVRVLVSAVLGFLLMAQLEPVRFDTVGLSLPAGALGDFRVGEYAVGAAGLSLGTGLAAWIEWALLYRALSQKIGAVPTGAWTVLRAGFAAGLAAGVALLARSVLPQVGTEIEAILICGVFGVLYLGLATLLGLEEGQALLGRILKRLRR
jgi:putative peptidoglycan lipid II flippase